MAASEAEQERALRAKYGGLLPKKKVGPRDQRYFDSADWALGNQTAGAEQKLAPKLRPSGEGEGKAPSSSGGRRASHLSQ